MHSIPARHISDEPLINTVHRHIVTMVLLLYGLGLLYISFVPFDFTMHHHSSHGMRVLSGMSMSIYAISDLLVNVVMYMPLGFLALMAARRIGFATAPAVIACLGMGTLLSFGIEKGQGWTVSRVSAWSDVMANSIGTCLGIIAYLMLEPGLRKVMRHLQLLTRRNVWLMSAQVLVAAILLVELRPYDVVVDPARTAKALRAAEPHPLARWNALPGMVKREIGLGRRASMTELSRVQWDYVLDSVSSVMTYGALAAVLSIGLAGAGRSLVSTLFSSGTTIAVVAGAVTVFRTFLISHGFDTMHFCCALAGWPIGCAVGWLCHGRIQRCLPAAIASLFVIVLTMSVLHEIAPGQWGPRHGSISWVPFLRHFGTRINDAFLDMSGDLLRNGMLAAIVACGLAASRVPWRIRSGIIVGLVALFAAGMECLHLSIPFRQADMTSAYLALFAGVVAVVAVRWAQDYRAVLRSGDAAASQVVVAHDALTSALIDGPTYDKSALTRSSRRSDASRKEQAELHRPL
jgi:glycopeptide antibiotics resistance protein